MRWGREHPSRMPTQDQYIDPRRTRSPTAQVRTLSRSPAEEAGAECAAATAIQPALPMGPEPRATPTPCPRPDSRHFPPSLPLRSKRRWRRSPGPSLRRTLAPTWAKSPAAPNAAGGGGLGSGWNAGRSGVGHTCGRRRAPASLVGSEFASAEIHLQSPRGAWSGDSLGHGSPPALLAAATPGCGVGVWCSLQNKPWQSSRALSLRVPISNSGCPGAARTIKAGLGAGLCGRRVPCFG